jgi:hexosaminidase
MRRHRYLLVLLVGLGLIIGVVVIGHPTRSPALVVPVESAATSAAFGQVVPAPVEAVPSVGVEFQIASGTRILIQPDLSSAQSAAVRGVGEQLAALLRPSTGYALPVVAGSGSSDISLLLTGADPRVGASGYQLDVTENQVVIRAQQPAGLFAGVETLRQLLPAQIEERTARKLTWTVPGGHIVDYPRFGYRGALLDVARHFFTVAQVEQYIDEIAMYKMNYLHLHLSDDQGWRIAIDGWPALTQVGASSEAGGGAGGFYTQAEYQQIVAYAQARYVTVIPEIDMPGHVGAALASYGALSCDGKATTLFTGIGGRYTSLCAGTPATNALIDAVIGQLAALTPGPYIHVGGDEAEATSAAAYAEMVGRAVADVRKAGKIPFGWQETTAAVSGPDTLAEYWAVSTTPKAQVKAAVGAGTQLVLSPGNRAYLDQKYNSATTLGLHWAGYVGVEQAYDWNPGAYLAGVPASAVLGVEASMWSETLRSPADLEYMAFPRLPEIAELGWSPWSTHDWTAFSRRLAAQGPRWTALGIDYYRAPQVPWPSD